MVLMLNYSALMLFEVHYLIVGEMLTAGSSDDYEVGTNLVGTKFDMKQKQWHTHEKPTQEPNQQT